MDNVFETGCDRSHWAGPRLRPRTWLLLAALSGPAAGAGLQVAPISLTLDANARADGLWLSNTGDAPLHAQVRVYRWRQDGGEEKLEPSRELAVSPPMLSLEPGARQLVRVIRLGTAPERIEGAYRVVVDELPIDAPAVAETPPSEAKRGLQFVLRYSVPVFVVPSTMAAAAAVPELHGRLVRDGAQAMLEIENRGDMHAQLGNLVFVDARGERRELVPGLLGYVLPGQHMRWPLASGADAFAAGGSLQSRINGAPSEQTIAVVEPSP